MRLHRLEVEAFGPFAGRVSLDLDTLSSAGLFLVHGPTGAGKTSLLDAVCFALYADVPGARNKRGLSSDHAAPGAVPTVRLELTVGGRRLRIERSPEFMRPKKRGEGSLRVQARVVLEERRGAAWVALSTRNDEVADLVKDVVGLGLAQFSRVVLLPQGDFATFLRATPEERREVLERLFDISVFSDVEGWLAETRRTSGSALDAARRDLSTELARLEDALTGVAASGSDADGATDPEGSAETDGPADAPSPEGGSALSETATAAVPARLAEVATELGTRLTAALAEVDAAEGADRLAQEALLEATRLADRRRRGERATALLADLDAAGPRHLEHVATLDAATRAAGVAGHLAAVRRAEADVGRAAAAVDTRHHLLASAGAGLEVRAERPSDLATRVHALDPAVAVLARAARTATELDQRLTRALAQRERADATVATAATALADAEPEVARLTADVHWLSAAGERLPGLEAALAGHEERRRAHDALDTDLAALEALRPRVLAARDAVLGHQDVLISLRQRRLDGMAAELAASLPDDAPCPVCGATDHPHRAPSTGDAVTPSQVTDAEVVLDAARAQLAVVEGRATALESAAATRRDTLGGLTRGQVEADLAAAVLALADARAQHDRARQDATRLDDLRARSEALATARDGALARSAALTEQLTELAEEAAEVARSAGRAVADHADCPCGTADPGHHAAVATALDALVRTVDEHAAAGGRLEVAAADLAGSLTVADFPDAASAIHAKLPTAEVEVLRRRVAEHDEARVSAGAVLDDPQVAAALSVGPPDVAAAHEVARAARHLAVSTSTDREVLARAVRVLAGLRPTLEATCGRVAALEERHARVRDLADTTGGLGPANTLKMRLTSFVLAARLEKVAALANERLRVMGAGRYVLEHTDERAAGGARSGLGLRVLDQWTGRSRETTTLSGGESFMASLALALGLADAVKEEAGGHDLATLFVDEGFGSLDDDSLEEVLTVLDGLREGGRAVGVVSHVADLRARVPHQVVVRKGTNGSTVEVRTGAPAAEPAA